LFLFNRNEIYRKIYFDETSCCAIELSNFFTAKYDSLRLGFKRTFDLNKADLIIICGYTSKNYIEMINFYIKNKKIKPKILALGGCAINKGPLESNIIQADMYLPGCPPRPESIVNALLKLKKHRGKNEN